MSFMDRLPAKILNQLLGVDNDAPLRPSPGPKPQSAADHWTMPILMERAAYLAKLAKYGEGYATETIKEWPQHSTMLSFRSRDGEAELQENFAHIFVVLEGNATLVVGGTLAGSRKVGPGEMRGASVEAGIRHQVRAGDIVHVPAGQPHQLLVRGENTITCLVLKIQENP